MSTSPIALEAAARALRGTSFDAPTMWDALAEMAKRLADPLHPEGVRLRDDATRTSGLSREMVDFAITSSARIITRDALATLCERTKPLVPNGLAGIVLAGNVTSAAFRALAVPLALGVPVLVKASSRDDVVAAAFARVLSHVDALAGARLHVVAYEGGDAALDAAFVACCDTVHVYGSDETIEAFRGLAGTKLHAHGHGLGVGLLSPDAKIEEAAAAFALDIAAYDQRGCLSPHAIYVIGAEPRRRAFATALHEALEARAIRLPRGPRDVGALAEENAARALAVMEGDVLEGASCTVACTDVFRASPLGRFVRVLRFEDEVSLHAALSALAHQLTCIGVAGTISEAMLYASHRWPRAQVVFAGAMQTPALHAPIDGRPCFEGFVVRETQS